MTVNLPWDQPVYKKAERKKTKKKVAKKATKKKPPVRKKAKKAAKKPEAWLAKGFWSGVFDPETGRVDRWYKRKLYQAVPGTFHKNEYELILPESMSLEAARDFVKTHHYLKGLGENIRFVYGMWHKPTKQLVGVAAFGSPPYVHVLPSSFPHLEDITQVGSELTRLVLLQGVPQNGESWFVGAALKDMRERQDQRAVISFSDPKVGHAGGIYKSLEAGYTGTSRARKGWVYLDDGTPVTENDKSKLMAACPIHRASYRKRLSRLQRQGLPEKEIKRRLKGQCGSGKSISGWEKAIKRFEEHGAPPYRKGTCLGEWRDTVLPLIAAESEMPGKHRYLWEFPEGFGVLSRRLQRRAMREMSEEMRGRSLQRPSGEIAYPCGICMQIDHKTIDCPEFELRRKATAKLRATPKWMQRQLRGRRNPSDFQSPWDQPVYGKRRKARRSRPRLGPVEAVVRFTEGWLDELAEGTPRERSSDTSPLQTEDVMLFVYWAPGVMRRELAQAWFGYGDVSAARFGIMLRGPSGWYLPQDRDSDLQGAAREFVSRVGAGRALDLVRHPVLTNPLWPDMSWRY